MVLVQTTTDGLLCHVTKQEALELQGQWHMILYIPCHKRSGLAINEVLALEQGRNTVVIPWLYEY